MAACGRTISAVGLAAVATAVLCCCGCRRDGPRQADAGAKVRVVATIFPVADVIKQIGGDRVDVHCMLGPGQSPHGFTLTAADMEELARARLVVVVGLGVDEWATSATARAAASGATLVEMYTADTHRHLPDRHGHHDAHPGAGDPHVWLDPVFMQAFAVDIAGRLAQVDPSGADTYRRRAREYSAELRKLDEQYRTVLGAVKRKAIVTYHPAFTHLAARYGLTGLSIRAADAEGIGAGDVEAVAAFIARHGVKTIFIEPQMPPDKLRAMADRSGCQLATLDPLGNPNVKGYDSYLAMMRSNLAALKRGLDE